MSVRSKILAVLTLALAPLTPAALRAEPSLRGIQTSDIDRSADPCTDFFEFANGAWRKQNPIPPSMVRWSRRWAAGELAKDQLKVILDEVSAKTHVAAGQRRAAHRRPLRRLHGRGAHRPARASSPSQPLLDEIDALQDTAGRAAHDRPAPRPEHRRCPSASRPRPTTTTRAQVIADIYASGLGLPDRDYYFKPEPRFAEAREKYRAHVRQHVQAGRLPAARRRRRPRTRSSRWRRSSPRPRSTTSALRDPKATDHKTTFAELQKLAPRFDWAAYFDAAGLPRARPQRAGAGVPAGVDRELPRHAARRLEDVPEVAPAATRRLLASPRPSWRRTSPSTTQYLRRREGDEAALEALRGVHRRAARRGARPEVRGEALPARGQGAHAGAGQEPAAGHGRHHPRPRLDGRRDQGPRLEKLSTFNPKIGYPDKWKDYSAVTIRRDAFWDERGGRPPLQRRRRPARRSASPWTAGAGA